MPSRFLLLDSEVRGNLEIGKYGIGATICTCWENQCLLYAGFLLCHFVTNCDMQYTIFLDFWICLKNKQKYHLLNKFSISDERARKARKYKFKPIFAFWTFTEKYAHCQLLTCYRYNRKILLQMTDYSRLTVTTRAQLNFILFKMYSLCNILQSENIVMSSNIVMCYWVLTYTR